MLRFGVGADLLTGCILPTCLSRDVRSYVRSIAWSQQGMAPNGGYVYPCFTVLFI
jgi:hypothetical protein